MGIRSVEQAGAGPHNAARGLFYRDEAGIRQPAPAPRFADLGAASWAGGSDAAEAAPAAAETAAPVHGGGEPYVQPGPAPRVGADTDDVLASAGLSTDEVRALREAGVLG